MITDAVLKIFNKDPTIKRHLLKTVSWRLIGSVDTALLGWFLSGQLMFGAKIGGLELFTKMLLYFWHERIWHRIKFGTPSRFARAEQVRKENVPNLFAQHTRIARADREAKNGARSFTIWLTGLSASGKSTIANELDCRLFRRGVRSYIIDGDNTRLRINSDLGFSKEDRGENIRRVAEVCRLFNDAGIVTIASFISPFAADREMAKKIIGAGDFIEVFVDADIETCKTRDAKGLYKLAEDGKIKNFTGISSPYEMPEAPDVHLNTARDTVAESADQIMTFLVSRGLELRAEGDPVAG